MKEHLETHSVIRGQIGLEIPSSLWDVETPEDFRYQAARKVDRYTSEGAPVGAISPAIILVTERDIGVYQHSACPVPKPLQGTPLSYQRAE